MYRKRSEGIGKYWDYVALDVVCLECAFILAYILRHGFVNMFALEIYRVMAVVVALADVSSAAALDLFRHMISPRRSWAFINSLKHVTAVMLLNVFFTFLIQAGDQYSRITVILTAPLHLIIGMLVRHLYRSIRKSNTSGMRSLFIVTRRDLAEDVIASIRDEEGLGFNISGLCITDRDLTGTAISGVPVLASLDTVEDYVCREWVDEVFFRLPRDDRDGERLYASFMTMGLTIHLDMGGYEVFKDQHQQVESIGRDLVVTTSINTISGSQLVLKRAVDIIAGILGSIFALIIMGVLAIPIKRRSPGPLIYSAERIGLNGKRFRMYKIRSMHLDADKRKSDLMDQNTVKDGMMFKLDHDPRVIGTEQLPDGTWRTGIGEFIRRTSLDEFPQFFNILKGDMSLVGTRPPTPDEWERYERHHRARLSTKPGLTGMWQVSGRSDITDFEKVVELDTYYISNWSIWLDVKIMLRTIGAVLRGRGAK